MKADIKLNLNVKRDNISERSSICDVKFATHVTFLLNAATQSSNTKQANRFKELQQI